MVVVVEKKDGNRRVYNKCYVCLFCGFLLLKIFVYLINMYSNEFVVVKILVKLKKS